MSPTSPMPRRAGLDWRWVRTPDADRPAGWTTMGGFLRHRLPAHVDVSGIFARGEVVDERGEPVEPGAAYRPNTLLWFPGPEPRDPKPDEPVRVLHADDRIVVVDKPHFQATTPQGTHARNTTLVQLRTAGWPDVAPAHRLDRLTAGVLVFTVEARWRKLYQELFASRQVSRVYEALARALPGAEFPLTVRSHMVKERGSLQARELPGRDPNAETRIEILEVRGELARYRLTPTTGRTHQLRVHLNRLGAPILHDPLYPEVLADGEQPDEPLQLVARELTFIDPVDGTAHRFVSRRDLQWPESLPT
ncbi:pseudouridine synthase [Enemella sp. A6]|uniref:pseudouridine synthase n=1 Tax=Enemella sp. A6 TaxID=3440152 RepID=UPI003EBE19F4